MISLTEAHRCISLLEPLPPAQVALDKALGLVCAEDVHAVHNCPTVDSSLKDGFAVVSSDSNHVALFLLALSGVRRLMGFVNCLPEKRQVLVTEELAGQRDWTQLVYSRVQYADGSLYAAPLSMMRRFEAMAKANALIEIPEGCAVIREGSLAQAWFFSSRSMP